MGRENGETAAGRSGPAAIRVGIFDENEMFALGLQASLASAPDVVVVTEEGAGNASKAGRDMDVAVVSPLAARRLGFSCPLVVCGEVPRDLAAGNEVLAELPRSTLSAGHLLVSVHAAAAGLRVTPPEKPPVCRLDERRLEVLRLLASGADTREIAQRLGYSDRTIKSVIREIQLTLGARNRVQAVAEGVRQGLIGLGAEP